MRAENMRVPVNDTSATPSKPHKPVHKRACHSPRPNNSNVSAFIQVCNGGFSKYLRPFSRKVIQSPVATISRAISA